MKTLRNIYEREISKDPKRSDKGRGPKCLLDLYEDLFGPYRTKATKVFEIGINRGGSIAMWERYFSNAMIYGLDLKSWCVDSIQGERIKTIKLDQSDQKQLNSFGEEYGLFDIGIDDGSHIWSHQIFTFETLFPFIKPGGLFIVEDICTSYKSYLDTYQNLHTKYDDMSSSPMEYFMTLAHNVAEGSYDGIDWMLFRRNAVVVKKDA